jgi:hypothetical protein
MSTKLNIVSQLRHPLVICYFIIVKRRGLVDKYDETGIRFSAKQIRSIRAIRPLQIAKSGAISEPM